MIRSTRALSKAMGYIESGNQQGATMLCGGDRVGYFIRPTVFADVTDEMKIAVITAAMRSGERGGAEAFYRGLTAALEAAGHEARELAVPVDESTFESVIASYERCYELDASHSPNVTAPDALMALLQRVLPA